MADSLKVMNRRSRPHSNTISGGRPPALDITISRPSNVRRNSEGSPGLPPPICISEPTPIEPSAHHNGFFNDKIGSTAPSSANSSRPSTPNSDNFTPPPPAPLPKHSVTAPVGTTNMLDSPTQKRKIRPRGSSITSNLINEIKESSTLQKVASKIKSSRHSSEDGDTERSSLDGGNISAPPSAPPSVAGTSGVYLANAKRNQDFHALFRSVPEEDSLIEDFGCALQKEILLQGRIYISESYLCFNANIFGWVTNLVIAFADIIEIEKKTTAYFIPNAIQISTDNAKHFFASFLSRDQAYDLMVEIWRIARPDLIPASERDEQDSVQCADDGSSDLSEEGSDSYYDSDTEDSYSDDESGSDLEVATATQQANGTTETNGSRKQSLASLPTRKDSKRMDAAARRRAVSELPRPSFQTDDKPTKTNTPPDDSGTNTPSKTANGDAATADKAAETTPQVHEKTECECGKNGSTEHYPNVVMDQVYSSSLEKIYNLLFHSEFIKKFFIEDQKLTDLNMNEWKKGEGDVQYIREMSYIKPLGGAIGPKSTKCLITEEVNHQDFEKYVSVLTTTATPDVPSGGSFTCKTRTCLTWAGKGKVRMYVTVLVDFTKSSWLKSTIEKASIDGQQNYYKDLDASMRAYFKEHPSEFADGKSASKSEGRRRKKGKRSKRSKSAEKPEVKDVKKEDKVDSAVHRILNSISNVIADGITAVIDMICSPTASHLTLLCLIAMVFINIFIARKMAYVEKQLSNISQHHASLNEIVQEAQMIPVAQQHREYNRQEEEDLWDWLGHIDPDKSIQVREQVTYPTSDNPEEQEAIWDEAIQASKAAKERLDKHMIELSSMIQKAESNLEEVTKAVNEQRQKIKQE